MSFEAENKGVESEFCGNRRRRRCQKLPSCQYDPRDVFNTIASWNGGIVEEQHEVRNGRTMDTSLPSLRDLR